LLFVQSNLSIDTAGDVDLYKFTFTGTPAADDSIDVNFTHASGDVDLRLYELNADGTLSQVDTSLSADDNESISLQGLAAGAYVFRIYCTSDSTNDYSLAIDLQPTGAAAGATNPFPTLNPTGVNGQTNRLRPTLSWTPAVNALAYQVWVNDVTAGKSNIYPTTLFTTSWQPPSDLISGHTYRWWVRGLEFGGQAHAWSLPQDFTVSKVQIAPINGPIYDLHPNIAWTGVIGADSYTVHVNNLTTGKNNIFAAGFAGFIGQDGWQLITNNYILSPGNTYKIWAKAKNSDGAGDWSAPLTFTIGNITFAKPLTAVSELTPSIPFTSVGGVTQMTYRLDDLTTGQNNLFPNAALTGEKWSPSGPLTIGHTYRLSGRALHPSNNGVGWSGPSITFTVNTSIYEIVPAKTLRPTLSWTALSGVASYEVRVSDVANGVNLTPGVISNNLSWTPDFDLISGHSYNISVRAPGGTWSAPRKFDIALVTEIKSEKSAGAYSILWTPLNLVTSYELWINDLTTGAKNLFPGATVNQPGSVSQYSAKYTLPASFTNGHKYRVFIKAENSLGLGKFSQAFDFTATP
jgi:hypothetical protein